MPTEPDEPPAAIQSAGEEARSEIIRSIPLPSGISTDAGVIGTNIGLALLTLIVLLATAAVFNQTLEENEHEIRASLRWLATPFAAVAGALSFFGEGSWGSRLLGPLAVLGLAAVLYALEDPSFGLNNETVVLTLSFLTTFVVLTYVYDGGQLFVTNRYGLPGAIRVFPAGVVMAVICVALTRIQGFQPGLVFGFVAAHTLTAPVVMTTEQKGHQIFWPALGLLGVSVAAWLLASPARELAEDGDTMWAALPEGIVIGLFLAGIESLFLSMIPIKFMDGHKLMSWSKLAWLGVAAASGFLFWHAMMNQERESLNALGQTGTTTVLILIGSALFIAGATHMFFRIRNSGRQSA